MLPPIAYNLNHADGDSMFLLSAGNNIQQYIVSYFSAIHNMKRLVIHILTYPVMLCEAPKVGTKHGVRGETSEIFLLGIC
jgi:hypothetical protein